MLINHQNSPQKESKLETSKKNRSSHQVLHRLQTTFYLAQEMGKGLG
jgi:hypothetical protein